MTPPDLLPERPPRPVVLRIRVQRIPDDQRTPDDRRLIDKLALPALTAVASLPFCLLTLFLAWHLLVAPPAALRNVPAPRIDVARFPVPKAGFYSQKEAEPAPKVQQSAVVANTPTVGSLRPTSAPTGPLRVVANAPTTGEPVVRLAGGQAASKNEMTAPQPAQGTQTQHTVQQVSAKAEQLNAPLEKYSLPAPPVRPRRQDSPGQGENSR